MDVFGTMTKQGGNQFAQQPQQPIVGGPVGTLQTGPIPGQQLPPNGVVPPGAGVYPATPLPPQNGIPAPGSQQQPGVPTGIPPDAASAGASSTTSVLSSKASASGSGSLSTNRYFHTLPPLHPHEVELRVPIAELGGELAAEKFRSRTASVGGFIFGLLIFPRGTKSAPEHAKKNRNPYNENGQ